MNLFVDERRNECGISGIFGLATDTCCWCLGDYLDNLSMQQVKFYFVFVFLVKVQETVSVMPITKTSLSYRLFCVF